MSRIVVKQKKKVRVESETGSLRIGTRTTCELTLRDPIAAEVHCEIVHSSSGYSLHDRGPINADGSYDERGSATGTYVNGLRVSSALLLSEGDEIVLGVTKLVVAMELDDGQPVLVLDLQEDKFFQKAKMTTGENPTWVPGDREAFKEAEINFGAFPALRVTGWSAIVVGVLAIIFFSIPSLRGVLLKPGPIHNLHAQAVGANNCSACHVTVGDDGMSGCANCHADQLMGRHPFPSAVGFAEAAQRCAKCHVEHLGTITEPKLVAGKMVRVRDPKFVPSNFRDIVACKDCHKFGDIPDETAARGRLARMGNDISAGSGSTDGVTERKIGRLEKFNHEVHVGAQSIACDKCHMASDSGGREFSPVAFNTCMTCHHTDGNLAYSTTEVSPDTAFLATAHDIQINSHAFGGANSGPATGGCASCHFEIPKGKGFDPNLVTTVTERSIFASTHTGETLASGDGNPRLYFSVDTRGHEGLSKDSNCSECHHNGTLASRSRENGQFFHALHLSELPTGDVGGLSDADAKRLSNTCSECHSSTTGASKLGGAVFDTNECSKCHGSAGNQSGAPRIQAASRTESVTRIDFPHDLHVNSSRGPLAKGCFACHEFGGDGDDLLAVPTTSAEVASCVACHMDHPFDERSGNCTECHDDTSASPQADLLATRDGAFSHFQPGHSANCNNCHEGVETAKHVSEIGMPSASDSSCFSCHFEKRFHWR